MAVEDKPNVSARVVPLLLDRGDGAVGPWIRRSRDRLSDLRIPETVSDAREIAAHRLSTQTLTN